mmetsp:Transcript_11847/g.24142  ORF Transcript_11847/g.24142 Transcript_11847/m.24142 type:complete len:94 (-) Transcript_11847:34-315(-)
MSKFGLQNSLWSRASHDASNACTLVSDVVFSLSPVLPLSPSVPQCRALHAFSPLVIFYNFEPFESFLFQLSPPLRSLLIVNLCSTADRECRDT